MGNLGNLLDLDSDLMLRSAQAGRLLLENTLLSAGMSLSATVAAVDGIVAGVDDFLAEDADFDGASAQAVLNQIENRLAEIVESGTDGAAFAARVAMLGSAVSLSGQDSKSKSRWAALALLVFANVSPHFTIQSDGAWEISNQPLLMEVVQRILSSVDQVTHAWKEIELNRSQRATPPPGGTDQDDGQTGQQGSGFSSDHDEASVATTPHSGSAVTVLPASELTESGRIVNTLDSALGSLVSELERVRVTLGNGNFGLLDREFATMLQSRALAGLNEFAESLRFSAGDRKSVFKEHHKTWERGAPFTFDVGLLPIYRREHQDIAYRLAVRVQSPGMFKPGKWKSLHEEIGRALRGVASIGAMREVYALAAPPRGGAKHGDGISVRDGPRGTIACVVRETTSNQHLLITAGHVVDRIGNPAPAVGVEVYTPPCSDPWEWPIGRVIFASLITRPWQAAHLAGNPPEADLAAIAVSDATRIARLEDRRREELVALRADTYQVTAEDASNGIPVVKGAGATRATMGHVQALALQVNITDLQTTRTVCATGLIEVRLERPAKPGDSGAPCFDQMGRLIGFVIAGSDRAWSTSQLTHPYPLVYVQPVHEIFTERGWEIF